MLKYLGAGLIFIGIFIIFYGMFFSMQIFLQEKEPPEIFKTENLPLSDIMLGGGEEDNSMSLSIENDMGLEDIVPIGAMLNVFTALSFAGLLIFGGAKLVGVGVSIFK